MADLDSKIAHLTREIERARQHAQRTDQGIDALQASFKNLYSLLHEQFQVIIRQLQSLEELPDLFGHLEEAIQVQFRISVLRQFEAQVMAHQAAIVANEHRIQALKEFLEKKRIQFEADTQRIKERYDNLLSQVAENNKSRRAMLDSHAYSLLEQVFPSQVQSKITNISLPSYNYLAAHASESAVARTAALLDAFKSVEETIGEFLARRYMATSDIENWIDAERKEGYYAIPAWVVEIEDTETGKKRVEIRFPKGFEKLPVDMRDKLEAYVRGNIGASRREPLGDVEKEALANYLMDEHNVIEGEANRFRSSPVARVGNV